MGSPVGEAPWHQVAYALKTDIDLLTAVILACMCWRVTNDGMDTMGLWSGHSVVSYYGNVYSA